LQPVGDWALRVHDLSTRHLLRRSWLLNAYLFSPWGMYPLLVMVREYILGFGDLSFDWLGGHARVSFLEPGSVALALIFIAAFCTGYALLYVRGGPRILLVSLMFVVACVLYFGFLYGDARLISARYDRCGGRDGIPYCMAYFELGLTMTFALNVSIAGNRWAFERFAGRTFSWRAPTGKDLKSAGLSLGLNLETVSGLIGTALRFIVGICGIVLALAMVSVAVQAALKLQTPTFDFVVKRLVLLVAEAVLLVTAISAGRALGRGSVSAGLGNVPIARPRLILVMGAGLAAYGALASYLVYRVRPDLFLDDDSSIDPWLLLLSACLAVVIAPIAEELFFRGWFWTGLRRHWRVIPTAALTSGLWLLLHIDPTRLVRSAITVLVLIPGAVILSMARELAGSVRAPIAIHAIYNLAVVATALLLVW
jgi:membrane protease YdiL (CAAX protease family)